MSVLLKLVIAFAAAATVGKWGANHLRSKGKSEKSVKLQSIAAGVVVAVMLLAILPGQDGSQGEKEQAAAAKPVTLEGQIKASSPQVTEVTLFGDIAQVTYFKKEVWDGKSWVYDFFSTALKVVQAVKTSPMGKPIKKVTFIVQLPTVDQLGKEGVQTGMKVVYTMATFDDAVWDKMYQWNMANLTDEITFKRLGLENAVDYCKDEDNAKYADAFCRQVALEQ